MSPIRSHPWPLAAVAVLLLLVQAVLPQAHAAWGHQHPTGQRPDSQRIVCQALAVDEDDCPICQLLLAFGYQTLPESTPSIRADPQRPVDLVEDAGLSTAPLPDIRCAAARGPPGTRCG